MTLRKRRQPTPYFKMPPPYLPTTGERAKLVATGKLPYCAMMQVAAEDTYQDYVVCRGFDPRIRKFIDYDVDDLENKPGVPVGKPYGKRNIGEYEIGQIFAAAIPVTRIGETPGVAATSQGHPADLDEEVEILYDNTPGGERVVTWLLLDSGGGPGIIGFCCGAFSQGSSVSATVTWITDGASVAVGDTIDVSDPCGEYYNTSGSGCGTAVQTSDQVGTGTGTAWYMLRLTCPDFVADCGTTGTGS